MIIFCTAKINLLAIILLREQRVNDYKEPIKSMSLEKPIEKNTGSLALCTSVCIKAS